MLCVDRLLEIFWIAKVLKKIRKTSEQVWVVPVLDTVRLLLEKITPHPCPLAKLSVLDIVACEH